MHIDTHTLSKLARISLSEDEHVSFEKSIGSIVSFIDTIQSAGDNNSSDNTTTTHNTNQTFDIVRDDVVVVRDGEKSATDIVAEAPAHTQNYIQVKKILN